MATILNQTYIGAKRLFLQNDCYFNGDLPPYFNFEKLLGKINTVVSAKGILANCCASGDDGKPLWPKNFSEVNHKIITNKDGLYAWRPLCLINPVLYIGLVNEMTSFDNWKIITKRFSEFQKNKQIECVSIPVVPSRKKSQKASQISNWLSKFEKASIKESLNYTYMFVTDITECYPSIYTHSVAWALHGQDEAKAGRENKSLLGNKIDSFLQQMQYGQTNGIPQGSVLMDFISEMVLGYVDILLSDKLKMEKIENYKIIRYRDDYRVFVDGLTDGENIIKHLSEILRGLGLKLGAHKTGSTSSIITNSIKREKVLYMSRDENDSNYKKLLHVHNFSENYKNAGYLKRVLSNFSKSMILAKYEDLALLLSIVTDIAYNNPSVYPQAAAIMSRLIDAMGCSSTRKIGYIERIIKKFTKKPNTGYLDIWLQRISYKISPTVSYNEPLCRILNDNTIQLWNMDWVHQSIKNVIDIEDVIDREKLEAMSVVISNDEVDLFKDVYPS